jgi:hypothetical protein
MTIKQLKAILGALAPEQLAACSTKDDAVALLYSVLTEDAVSQASAPTGGETPAPPGATEVFRCIPLAHTVLYYIFV